MINLSAAWKEDNGLYIFFADRLVHAREKGATILSAIKIFRIHAYALCTGVRQFPASQPTRSRGYVCDEFSQERPPDLTLLLIPTAVDQGSGSLDDRRPCIAQQDPPARRSEEPTSELQSLMRI